MDGWTLATALLRASWCQSIGEDVLLVAALSADVYGNCLCKCLRAKTSPGSGHSSTRIRKFVLRRSICGQGTKKNLARTSRSGIMFASCDVKFPIRLEGLAYSHEAFFFRE